MSPTTPTPEQLLSIAREYWRPDRYQHLTQEPSPEAHRREARWEEALQKVDRWHAFLTDLKQVLPDFLHSIGSSWAASASWRPSTGSTESNSSVPAWKEPPETRLFHALFSNQPENVP